MKRIPVDIITLNFNGLEFTKMFVESLYANTEYPFNLIIVDNASTDGSVEYLKQLEKEKANLIVHYNKVKDKGFADGINTGLSYSKNPYVLIINNDIIISEKGWLKKLVECLESDNKIAIVGCKLLYPNNLIQHGGGYLALNAFSLTNPFFSYFYHRGRFLESDKFSQVDTVPFVTFACILCRKDMFGKLDEQYLLGTFEDLDKCCEIMKAGYKIVYNGNVSLYHYETATQFKRPKEIWINQQEKNRNLFKKKWEQWLKDEVKKNPSFFGWSRKALKDAISRGEL